MRISSISNNNYKPNFGSLIIRTSHEDVESSLLRHLRYIHDCNSKLDYYCKSPEERLRCDELLEKTKSLIDFIDKEGIEKSFKEKLVLLEEMSSLDRDIAFTVKRGKEFFLEKKYKNTVEQYFERMSLGELKQIKKWQIELSKYSELKYGLLFLDDINFVNYDTKITMNLFPYKHSEVRPTFIPAEIKKDSKHSKYNLVTHAPIVSSTRSFDDKIVEEVILSFDDIKKAQKAYDYLAGLRDKYENGTDFDILNWSVQGLKFFAEYIHGTEKIERIIKNTKPEDEYGILDQIIARKESLARGQSKKDEEVVVEDDNSVKTINVQNPFIEKALQKGEQSEKVDFENDISVKTISVQNPFTENVPQEEKQDTKVVVEDNNSVKTTEEQIPIMEKSLQEENIDDNKNAKQEKETFIDRLLAKFGLQKIKK